LDQPVEDLLRASGIDMTNGGGLEELEQLQVYLWDYKIIVNVGLSPDKLILIEFPFRIKICSLYDADTGHYNVINNIKADICKRYLCNACYTLCLYT
jgi:hypothetical protein